MMKRLAAAWELFRERWKPAPPDERTLTEQFCDELGVALRELKEEAAKYATPPPDLEVAIACCRISIKNMRLVLAS